MVLVEQSAVKSLCARFARTKNIFYRFDSFLTNKILLKGVKRFFARTLRNVVSVNGR